MLPALLAGVLIAISFLVPGTTGGAVLGWISVCGLVFAARFSKKTVRDLYWAGVVTHAIAFYWLPATLSYFGGFPQAISYLLFLLFCLVSAIQFGLCGFLFVQLRRIPLLRRFALALPLAWFSAEVLVPRLFPWALVHTQLPWQSLAALAQYVGVFPLGALMLWILTLCVTASARLRRREPCRELFVCAVLIGCMIGLGRMTVERTRSELAAAPAVTVGIVQGNLEAKQKRDVKLLEPNLERYRALSASVLTDGAELLLWPETVATSWLPEEFKNIRGTRYDVFPGGAVPLFYGGLSFREGTPAQAFNAVFLRNTEGQIAARYYKRILMPFGEYMPFADLIPALRELSPSTGDFTVGDQPITTTVALRTTAGAAQNFGIGMLICYEDLVPSLSNEAVETGANILVNFTNDAWYGETVAPYQHHMLAAWRAVETDRYLLRVTNTGVTGIVSPLGETERELPIFKEGTILQPVKLLTRRTVQARIGNWPVVVLASIVTLFALNSWFKRKE